LAVPYDSEHVGVLYQFVIRLHVKSQNYLHYSAKL